MSIREGLARNRALYRRLFGEEADPVPPLPGREDAPFFEEIPDRELPGEPVFRLTEPDFLLPEVRAEGGGAGAAAGPAVRALLLRFEDEARLNSQDLEE